MTSDRPTPSMATVGLAFAPGDTKVVLSIIPSSGPATSVICLPDEARYYATALMLAADRVDEANSKEPR
jgi:hypothetical protein